MKFFNTLTKKKQSFVPLHQGTVSMYLCGPTVYDKGHLGHARSAVAFDVIRKYLRYSGYEVTFVMNYTDIDDKMINRATQRNISVKQLADEIIPHYERDYAALGIEPADKNPKATTFIPQIVSLIETLLKNKNAYVTDDGVYFSVKSFSKYGALSHQKLDELIAGARVEVNENKKAPEDFALWKKEKPGEPSWPGPRGMVGRPGWHIECSAMTTALLGTTFDIHAGGQDLIFPHHEDEIAQSEAATGKPFARFWLHNGFIRINKEKMSKSLGNFFTIEDVLKKYDPFIVRYFLLSTHYRMPIDFSDDLLEQARNSLQRLRDFVRRLEKYLGPKSSDPSKTADAVSVSAMIKSAKKNFEKAMNDDIEIVKALAVIFDFVREMNGAMDKGTLSAKDQAAAAVLMKNIDAVLGVLKIDDGVDAEIKKTIDERNAARKAGDFAKADALRKALLDKGIELEDTPRGTIWKKIL